MNLGGVRWGRRNAPRPREEAAPFNAAPSRVFNDLRMMNTLRWLALLVAFLLPLLRSGTVEAAPDTVPAARKANRESVTLTTSLVTPFFGAYCLEGKLRASSLFGVLLNASYLSLENGDFRARSGTLGAGVDYFFQGDSLRGFYVEAVGELWLASWRHEPSGEVAPVVPGYAGIALLGYQFVFDAGPVLDLGAGAVAFHVASSHVEISSVSASSGAITKLYPAAKLNVGWAF